jgi:hypothetical protein
VFTVLFTKDNDIFSSMVVYDMSGKQVYVKDPLAGNPIKADLSKLQSGIYFAVFMTADKNLRMTEKLAIVN